MPSYDKVSIMDRSGAIIYYSSYSSARSAASSGDLIQIWANLTEQIVLLNGADIWIAPGVTIKSGSSDTTIIAPTSGELNCKIYGFGIIKNDTNGSCIFINNEDAKLKIECDVIEGQGGSVSSVNIQSASEFHLSCSKVYSRDFQALRLGLTLNPGLIQDINLNITRVETGNLTPTYTGTTAITTRGNGFVKIDEILCRNRGHCLSHREGNITAQIKKLQTINNISGDAGAALHVRQYDGFNPGIGTQKLIIYFDEIESLTGTVNSSAGIEIGEGTGVIIGRKVYCSDSPAIQIQGNDTSGYVKCNEIISQGSGGNAPVNAIEFSNFNNEITFDANYVQGYRNNGVIFINDANVQIKNALIKNSYTGTTVASVGIFIAGSQIISLVNAKIVTGSLTSGQTIYYSSTSINVKNYGLFVNKAIESNVNLIVGTGSNYQYIINSELT